MNPTEREEILRFLRDRRDAVTDDWYRAVLHTSFAALPATEVRRRLGALTDRAIDLLTAEPFDGRKAREIGEELVGLHYVEPEALGKTLEVLAGRLVEGLPAGVLPGLHPRLAALTSAVAAGFLESSRETILREQENIRAALLSERRRTEEALRSSEASLAEAQRIAGLGHWTFDLEKDELRWSDEVFRIFGVGRWEFRPTLDAFYRAVHPEDRRLVERAVVEALGGAPRSFDHRVVRPGGEVRVVRQRMELFYDEWGGLVRMVGTVQDVTERRALEEQLEHQATHDPLTNLPNRALLMERLERALARGAEGNATGDGEVSVLFLDLDNFKVINDSLGHAAGDGLLLEVARRLKASLRPEDTIARLGGDEFAVLVEGLARGEPATRVAQRIVEELRAPFVVEGREVFVSASIGIASGAPGRGGTEDLLRNADVAMYRAKAGSEAGYEVFDPSMNAFALERLELGSDLQRAVERGEFVLRYQPRVRLAGGKVVGVEALLRWDHPVRGLLSPAEFIALAEETGAILNIGRWVTREACRQARAWQDQYALDPPLQISVNLSARQFMHPKLGQEIADILSETGVAPEALELEITESTLMGDGESVFERLTALKALGVRLSIDDFGTGYSSLSYLKRLPVDCLKIDKSFVEGLDKDTRDRLIVMATISLAHTLNLEVVAEGVETAGQLSQLRGLRCELVQGNHLAPALAAEEVAGVLASDTLPKPD